MTVFLRLTLLCACLIANGAEAAQQEKLTKLRQRISALQQQLEKTSESKSEAADALRESERAISTSNRVLKELASQQRAASNELGLLQQQSRHLKNKIRGQQTLLGKWLVQQYLGGQQEHFKLLLNNRDPDQAAREMQYYQYIARSRATEIKNLRDNLGRLTVLVAQTRHKGDEIAALQTQQKKQIQTLEKDKRARQKILTQFSRQIKQQRRKIGRLQRDEAQLSQLVDQLAEVLAQPDSSTTFNNDTLPDDRFDGKPFAQLKGKLVLPVKGKVGNKFGSVRPDSPLRWKGLLLLAASGHPVKAVAAGRVVFADWLRGFGNLLIIDHGQGYMSLYGNNETLYKQVGDTLRGGDTVAAVGNTGGNEDSGLYFELRHKGKPLDPVKWIKR